MKKNCIVTIYLCDCKLRAHRSLFEQFIKFMFHQSKIQLLTLEVAKKRLFIEMQLHVVRCSIPLTPLIIQRQYEQ